MMIEEFMVLANEEVAKWCIKRKIPFLSRVHDAPSAEKSREIVDILLANKDALGEEIILNTSPEIEPHHIRSVLEKASSNDELFYRLSHLLLPKMAKAVYAEKPVRHFGLALTHYAHFTSPIRRYPDLLLHRMIKYHLSKSTHFDKKTYDKQMKKWGESLSEKERTAEDVSRAVDDVAMCRYMSNHVGDVYDGVIS
jgi:ribonuclease R